MTGIRWQSGVDFVVLVVAIYLLLKWSREARALRLSLTMSQDQIRRMDSEEELQRALTQLTTEASPRKPLSLRAFRPRELGLKIAALVLSALVWGVTFRFPGRSVRMQTVPVEFTDMPAGLTIASQSTNTVQLWLRGNDFLINSVNLAALVARCDRAQSRSDGAPWGQRPAGPGSTLNLMLDNISPALTIFRVWSKVASATIASHQCECCSAQAATKMQSRSSSPWGTHSTISCLSTFQTSTARNTRGLSPLSAF